jgi:hypothetical protein
VLFLGIPCLVVRSGTSQCPRAVLWRLVQGDLEPGQPIAVTCPASSEVIDALLGTKRGSPRVVPDETKLAITNCASRGSARSKAFGAVGHCSLLLVSSLLFVDHPFFSVALHQPVRLSNACSLRRSRSTAQLNVGKCRASKGVAERYEGLWRSPLKPTTYARSQRLEFGSPKAMSDTPLEAGYGVAQRVPLRGSVAGERAGRATTSRYLAGEGAECSSPGRRVDEFVRHRRLL